MRGERARGRWRAPGGALPAGRRGEGGEKGGGVARALVPPGRGSGGRACARAAACVAGSAQARGGARAVLPGGGAAHARGGLAPPALGSMAPVVVVAAGVPPALAHLCSLLGWW